MVAEVIQRDEFCSTEYVDTNASLPPVIVLNDKTNYGYFITVNVMAKCGWIEFDESQLIGHTFHSGKSEQGVLIRNPRMLVVAKTDLYQYDVEETKKLGNKVVIGRFNLELKANPNIKAERIYAVMFLSDENKPLHTSPLKYVGKGINGTTFDIERQAFKQELEGCHAIANRIPAKTKTDKFHALGVFAFTTKAELCGSPQKNWCCRVVAHEKPTLETWQNYFLGYSDFKTTIWETLEPDNKIDILKQHALPSSDDTVTLPDSVEVVADTTVVDVDEIRY
jgi:hypothetical protein